MKPHHLPFLFLPALLIFLPACTNPPATDKGQGYTVNSTSQTTGGTASSDDAQYKLLYNSPAGGNPENKGKIIFSATDGKASNADHDLYTINPDGTDRKKLTDFGKFISHPVWSPDYSRIAYSRHVDEGNTDKIFIMTADGSESRQLTFGEGDDKFPTWSPDGKQIAYISYRGGHNGIPNLFVMDDHGQNNKQLTFVDGENTVLWPSWSPVDNDTIAFSYNKAGSDIDFRLHTIKSDGTDEKEILSSTDKDLSDHEPGWSPDGKTMYFISNRTSQLEIWKLDYEKWAAGQPDFGPTLVSHLSSVNTTPDHRPRVSPDGTKLVFYGVGPDWNNIGTNLYTMNVDGSNLTNITKSIDGNEWPDW